LTLVPPIFAPSFVDLLHDLTDLAARLVGQLLGLTAIFLDQNRRLVAGRIAQPDARIKKQMAIIAHSVKLTRSECPLGGAAVLHQHSRSTLAASRSISTFPSAAVQIRLAAPGRLGISH
jgi:hypothetical protein